jgi:small conductance mechanosensitive channel
VEGLASLDWSLDGVLGTALIVLVVALVALILLRVTRGSVQRLLMRRMARQTADESMDRLTREDAARRVRTLSALFEWVLRLFVIGAAAAVILIAVGLTELIVAIAIVLAAIAVAAQNVIRDYVGGVIIVMENHFGLGDYVQVAGQSGEVEAFSLRRTVLRSDDGDVVSVPNGEIRIARNETRTWARVNIEVLVTDATRLEEAIQAIDEAGRAMKADPVHADTILEVPAFQGVAGFDDKGARLLVRGRIAAVDRQRTIGDYRRRVLEALVARGLAPTPAASAPTGPSHGGPPDLKALD